MTTHSRIPYAVVFFCCLFIGCNNSPMEAGGDGPTKVRLQLNWLPDAQFGGYYAAKVSGLYERAGLDVEIIIGGPDAAVLPKLAMRRVEFGLGNADQLLLARQEGADVTAVLAVMQDNPRCIMVHESSGIDSFDKLRNVTLAMGEGNAFAAFLKSNLPLTDVRIVSYAGNVAKFVIDDQFAQQSYVFSEPIVAAAKGANPQSLMVSDLGFNPYAGIVMTNRKLMEQHPETVERFVQATRKGWLQYLDDPTAANQEIHRLNPEIDFPSLTSAVETIRTLCLSAVEIESLSGTTADKVDSSNIASDGRDEQPVSFGWMEPERWTTLHKQLSELGLLKPNSVPFQSSTVFTNQFIGNAMQPMPISSERPTKLE